MHNFHSQIEAKNGKLIPLPLHQQRRSTKKWFVAIQYTVVLNRHFMHTENQMGFSRHSFICLIACNEQFQKIPYLMSQSGGREGCLPCRLFTFGIFLYPKQGGVGQAPGPLP